MNIFTAGPLTTSPNTYVGNMAYALDKAAILGSASPVPTFMIDLTNFGFTTQPAITQARRRILTPFPPLLYDPQMVVEVWSPLAHANATSAALASPDIPARDV